MRLLAVESDVQKREYDRSAFDRLAWLSPAAAWSYMSKPAIGTKRFFFSTFVKPETPDLVESCDTPVSFFFTRCSPLRFISRLHVTNLCLAQCTYKSRRNSNYRKTKKQTFLAKKIFNHSSRPLDDVESSALRVAAIETGHATIHLDGCLGHALVAQLRFRWKFRRRALGFLV